MSDSNYNFGPYWTINSNEAGLAFIFLCAVIIFPVAPITALGWHIGVELIGNNFAKWGLAILFTIAAYIVLIKLHDRKGILYSGGFVFLQYLSLDYIKMVERGNDTLVMVKLLNSLIHWGLSLS